MLEAINVGGLGFLPKLNERALNSSNDQMFFTDLGMNAGIYL
jgi:hypothetical protein